jgi:hypothetical protein
MRHTVATNLLEGGIAAAKVAKILGHRQGTLEKVYDHVLSVVDIDDVIKAPGLKKAPSSSPFAKPSATNPKTKPSEWPAQR